MLVFGWSRTLPERLAMVPDESEWTDAREVPVGATWHWAVQNPTRKLAVIGAALLGYASAFPILITWGRRRRVAGSLGLEKRSPRFVLGAWCVGVGLAAGSVLSGVDNLGGPRLPTGITPGPPTPNAGDALLMGMYFAGTLYFICSAIIAPLARVGSGLLRGPRLRREAEARRLSRRARREARVRDRGP